MIIRQKKKRYNPDTKRREEYFDDREFHSLQEIKDYCVNETNYILISDSVKFVFTIMDTNEDVEIIGSWKRSDDDFYYVILDYWF
jgi:hypothetical protein